MTHSSLSDLSEERLVACPYCGESYVAVIDCSAGDQQYVEDCPVCCAPILFEARMDQEGCLGELFVRREND